ncbi:MAG: hypothetical protein NDJ94_19580 [Vicinamibacteria bacterium]|nr:hypothetical protein [Vicinamibacteria bacterium]
MNVRRALALAILLTVGTTAPGIFQLVRTGGYLYYRNGADEPTYLRYDFSLHTQSLSRTGQYPVTLLHHAGLSAGWINLAFDSTLPLAFLLLVHATFRALGFEDEPSALAAWLVTVGPLVSSGANPLVQEAYVGSVAEGWSRYVTLPSASFLPISRTPEPQCSLVLLAGATLVGARRRSLLPLYLVLPFLYPFVSVSAAFVVLAVHAGVHAQRSAPGRSGLLRFGALALGAWLALSLGAGLLLAATVPPQIRDLMAPGHAPFLSFTSVVALVLFAGLRGCIRADLRRPALLVALAPMAAVNLQVVMGWRAMPSWIELFAGGECIAIVLALALMQPATGGVRILRAGALAATALLFAWTCCRDIRLVAETPLLDGPVLALLQRDPSRVATSDGHLARLLAMVFPRQGRTALDYTQIYPQATPDATFPEYLSDRAAISSDPRRAGEFAPLLQALDAGYAHHGADSVAFTNGRSRVCRVNRDVLAEAARWPRRSRDLVYLTVRNGVLSIDP